MTASLSRLLTNVSARKKGTVTPSPASAAHKQKPLSMELQKFINARYQTQQLPLRLLQHILTVSPASFVKVPGTVQFGVSMGSANI